MSGTAIIDFWFEFASTYSYPAAMRIGALAQASGVQVRWRPFLLGPIFKAQGWENSPFNIYPVKGRYMWRDLERICAALDLPFTQPVPFPQNTVLAARVALIALAQPWGKSFCRAVYRAEFGSGRNIGEPAAIADVLTGLGQDAQAVLQRAQMDATGTLCACRLRKLSGLESSAPLAFSPPMESCSGATTGWKRPWPGRSTRLPVDAVRASGRHCGRRSASK